MRKKLFLMVFVFIGLTGCGAEVTEKNLSSIHFVKSDDMVGDKTPEERAIAIKSSLGKINGISGNAVVVEGHTAIIGLRLEDNMEKESQRLRQAADEAARAADEYIESTSITTNTRIVALIEEMEHKRAN